MRRPGAGQIDTRSDFFSRRVDDVPDDPGGDEQNRIGWDAVADEYQNSRGWPHEDLVWGHRVPPESELRVIGEIRAKRCVVLGCGGGQDVVALLRLGAATVVGVDMSAKMLAHASALLSREGLEARLVHGSVADLSPLADASMDVVVSVHVLSYVEQLDRCLAEAYRVLVPGGVLAFSVHHPLDASTIDSPPYSFTKSYFQVRTEWTWGSIGGGDTPFRSYHRSVADWFAAVRDAGFAVEELLEPPPSSHRVWAGDGYASKLEWVPGTLIVRGRK
jgi:SAM-dependent methyltransferase